MTVLYVAINLAYLSVLGLEGIRKSDAVAAAVMRAAFGASGAIVLSVIVIFAAASTINASIFTGARLYHALGQDLAETGTVGEDQPATRLGDAGSRERRSPPGRHTRGGEFLLMF